MSDCKGLLYRGYSSVFESGGRVARHEGLRPLKRMSCPGCEKCHWIPGDMADHISCGYVVFPKEITAGDTYKAVVVGDWEGFELSFTKVF